ncbi:MAG: tetratricopeptide repeat protein, partial [Pseudomonadota bacterium]
MGAWNRMGDIYFAADDWRRAKEAYRYVLEQFPAVATQTAAARLALAEILYREEQFRQTLDLYEREMASRPYADYLYGLARAAYVRKSIAAGEFLFRLGEIPSARNHFMTLIREDYTIVDAHRGYIKCAAAQKKIPDILLRYRNQLEKNPDDPVTLYALGLSLTYRGGKKALEEAKSLIQRAIGHQGQIEYFHQTLGYIYEVLETVHGERGGLEAALESYRKAYFLNDPKGNPENAANLSLNLGNISFLLGQYGKAFESYVKRFETGVPFDHEETEILFYRRFGAAAFQVREREQPIQAFNKALDLIEKRIQLKRASEVMGRINRYIFDRIITQALKRPEPAEGGKKIAERQADLNRRVFEVSRLSMGPPPDPGWTKYREALAPLISEEEDIIRGLGPFIPEKGEASIEALSYMILRAREALEFPRHLIELKAEMLDRLGLAYQEAENWREARETFERAYTLNERLGLYGNLVGNQRSMALNAYMEAGTRSGEERKGLLTLASEGFERVIRLVQKHGVKKKGKDRRKKALISLGLDVSLDRVSSSQAMHGFSAEQEVRLAEAFISRIQIELGRLTPAREAINRQLARYPPGNPISEKDLYGVSLLYHRGGQLAYAMRNASEAFDRFRRSAELSLKQENPVSAGINVANMARVLAQLPDETAERARFRNQLAVLDRKTTRLLYQFPNVLERLVIPAYHNTMGVFALSLNRSNAPEKLEKAARDVRAIQSAGMHFAMGLKWLEKYPRQDNREFQALRGALHLNMAEVSVLFGEGNSARDHFNAALEIARPGLTPEIEWRALAGLGRLKEALEVLEGVTILRAGSGPGEVMTRFAPLVVESLQRGETEEAFNLVERLSEIERVHRLIPLVLGPIPPDERTRLRRIYPRLVTMQDLRRKLAAAKDSDKDYLSKRLSLEKTLLERDIGDKRQRLPSLAEAAGREDLQDRIMLLMGLALHAEDVADAALKEGKGPEPGSLRNTYQALVKQYGQALAQAKPLVKEGEAPGIIGILRPDPVEVIDVMEGLPDEGACIRLFPVPGPEGRWIAFTITPDDIHAGQFGPGDPLPLSSKGLQTIVYEDISGIPFRISGPVALSATHLIRSIRNRRPFKRTLLALPPEYTVPGSFEGRSLPANSTDADILATLPGVHTILFTNAIYKAGTVPTRSGQLPVSFMALGLDQGRAFPLMRLSDRLSNVSLALLPGASLTDAYPVGHLFSLFGVPTVLLPRSPRRDSLFPEAFLMAYGSSSAEDAARKARTGTGAGEDWIQLGYRGMRPEEASVFAGKHFSGYVKMGLEAFKTNRPLQALTLFENALDIALEIKDLKRYLPDLHKYSRESAYAAGRLDRALTHARALVKILAEKEGGSEVHAEALLKLGLLHARAEHYDKALPVLEKAAEIMADLELGPEQVAALSDLGVVLENATEYDRALIRFQSAASLSKALNKKELLARQYRSIGRLYDLRLNQYARARQIYGDAYHIYRELGQKGEMAQSLLDMGRCYRLMGNFKESHENYLKALDLLGDDRKQERLRAKVLMEQANNAWYLARYQDAFDLQREIYELARKRGWHLEQVMALNTSGLTWWTLGDHHRALRELERALEIARSLKSRRDEVATTLNNMGMVYREMGRYQEALEALDKALDIDREIRSRWAIAYDLRNKALTYLRMGETQKAVPLFKEALDTARAIGNRINEAKILLGFGEALATLGRNPEAQDAFNSALSLSRAMAMRETEWRALYGLALLRLKAGQKQKARELLTGATAVIEGMRAEIKLDQLKDGFITNKMSVYETLVALLVDLGETTEAFDTVERSRARNLIDLLGNQRLNLQGAVDQDLYDRRNTLKARIREHEALMAHAGDDKERAVYEQALNGLRDDYRDLMLEIQTKNPELASLISVNPLSLNDIRALLDPGVALLAFYVVQDEVLSWLVMPESVELFRTPIGRESLDKAVLNYRRMIQNLEPLENQSKELFSWLLSKTMPRLGSVRVLGIVPHGKLHYLSFATLFDGESYLADRLSLFYLPSAGVIRYTIKRRQEGKSRRVLAIGNPNLGNPALNLPFAEHEVSAIGWNFPDITVMTGHKATESWVVKNIEDFGIIHLASHGEFDPINP